jgi:resuscitation-promoting factor RpfA
MTPMTKPVQAKPLTRSGKALATALGLATLMLTAAPADAFFYRRGPLNPLPPHAIGDIVRLDYGFRSIHSMDRDGPYYVVEGLDRRGLGARVVLDAYHGYLIDSMALRPPANIPQRLARAEPQGLDRGAIPDRGTARIVPVPPPRPPVMRQIAPDAKLPAARPPEAATAPASTLPGSLVPKPVPRQSLIPDTGARPSGAAPAPPETPASRAAPRLVNPQDVRSSGDVERTPPMARSTPAPLAPAILDDATPAPRGPETPAVPVTPLN